MALVEMSISLNLETAIEKATSQKRNMHIEYTLRENQASCDNMKSDNREKEKEIFDMFNLGLGLQGE